MIKNITIHRKWQMLSFAKYQVTVDGLAFPSMKGGQSITTQSNEEITTVEIVCYSFNKPSAPKLTLKLKAGLNTSTLFKPLKR